VRHVKPVNRTGDNPGICFNEFQIDVLHVILNGTTLAVFLLAGKTGFTGRNGLSMQINGFDLCFGRFCPFVI